jgi:putative peptidoglycan lipid II flippase
MSSKLFRPVKASGALLLVTITILFSNLLGLLRDRIIAIHFGTSSATDVYNASFLIPDTLFNLFIAGALAAAFVPVFTEYLTQDKEEAYKIANTLINSAMLVIGVLSIIALIFMHQIIGVSFPTANQQVQAQIVSMTRLMLSSALVFTISNTIGNILMCYKHFFAYSISPLLYNLGIILGVIFLQDKIGIYSAAVGVIGGGVLHCLIRLIDMRAINYKYKLQMDLRHPGFKKIVKLMIPRAIGIIATQINIYLFTIIGIQLTEGGVAAFNFARNIQSVAVTLFGMAFGTAVFPYLTSAISAGNKNYSPPKCKKPSSASCFLPFLR